MANQKTTTTITHTQKVVSIDPKLVENICKANDIAFLGVFGSYARREQTSKSDIDLLVRFSKRKSLLDLVRIERELTEQFGKKVDLVTLPSLSPYLKDRVLSEVQPIYEQEG